MSHFEKVSFEQWKADCGVKGLPDSGLKEWYDAIKLPKQATAASAGFAFAAPQNRANKECLTRNWYCAELLQVQRTARRAS